MYIHIYIYIIPIHTGGVVDFQDNKCHRVLEDAAKREKTRESQARETTQVHPFEVTSGCRSHAESGSELLGEESASSSTPRFSWAEGRLGCRAPGISIYIGT
jgi:hypothetical protein